MKILLLTLLVVVMSGCDQSEDKAAPSEDVTQEQLLSEEDKDILLADIGTRVQENPDLLVIQANVAVNMFRDVCIANVGKSKERIAFLDSKFSRYEGASKDLFLGLFRVKSGNAWAVVFPENGIYAVVVDENENCYVAALHADEMQIHRSIKALYDNMKKEALYPYLEYSEIEQGALFRSSNFKALNSKGYEFMTVLASTNDAPPEG